MKSYKTLLLAIVCTFSLASCGGGGGGSGPGPGSMIQPPTTPTDPGMTNLPLPSHGTIHTHWIYPNPTVQIEGDSTPAQRRALNAAIADMNRHIPAGYRLRLTGTEDATISVRFDFSEDGPGIAFNDSWREGAIRGGGTVRVDGDRTEPRLRSAIIHEIGHIILDFPDDYENHPGPFGYCCAQMNPAAGRFIAQYYYWGRWIEAEPTGDVIAMAHYHPDAEDVQLGFRAPPAFTGQLGPATWTGNLVGYEPGGRLIRGNASIRLDATPARGQTSGGHAAFTGLREPGSAYTRADLEYALTLYADNMFQSAGNSDVNGAVVSDGSSVVGTLRRADLDAAFGASR